MWHAKMPCMNVALTYRSYRSFSYHTEHEELASFSYLTYGSAKTWYVCPASQRRWFRACALPISQKLTILMISLHKKVKKSLNKTIGSLLGATKGAVSPYVFIQLFSNVERSSPSIKMPNKSELKQIIKWPLAENILIFPAFQALFQYPQVVWATKLCRREHFALSVVCWPTSIQSSTSAGLWVAK